MEIEITIPAYKCYYCDGHGWLTIWMDGFDDWTEVRCLDCNGKGFIDRKAVYHEDYQI